MLQQSTADDFVVATGETHSVGEFVQLALEHIGIENWRDYVRTDPAMMRPAEVDLLIGDAAKARECSAGSHASPSRSWSRSWSTPTSSWRGSC